MIIGNLGRDPEMRFTPSGRAVTSFSVATSRNWTSAEGQRRSETEWFNIIAWGQLAEICNQYLKKGQQVYVEGRLQTRKWEDEQGNKRSSTEVIAREMVMLNDRKDKPEGESSADSEESFPVTDEEDYPF
jgi:single-strand DNA-binding protein